LEEGGRGSIRTVNRWRPERGRQKDVLSARESRSSRCPTCLRPQSARCTFFFRATTNAVKSLSNRPLLDQLRAVRDVCRPAFHVLHLIVLSAIILSTVLFESLSTVAKIPIPSKVSFNSQEPSLCLTQYSGTHSCAALRFIRCTLTVLQTRSPTPRWALVRWLPCPSSSLGTKRT
jgi:hypothetical protein